MRKCSAAASRSNAPNKEHPADGTRRTGAPRRRNPPNRERPADETRRIGAPRRRNPPNRECRTRGTRGSAAEPPPLPPRSEIWRGENRSGGAQTFWSAPRRKEQLNKKNPTPLIGDMTNNFYLYVRVNSCFTQFLLHILIVKLGVCLSKVILLNGKSICRLIAILRFFSHIYAKCFIFLQQ